MLNLPIHQHGMCLYLLRSHLISLMNILYFSVHRVGIFCEMTKYFILEGAIVIGIHFKCWFSMFITRIYNYFCVLTLCLVFLLSSLINLYLCNFLGIFYVNNHVICKQRGYFFCLICMPFISFSCAITLAKISNTWFMALLS